MDDNTQTQLFLSLAVLILNILILIFREPVSRWTVKVGLPARGTGKPPSPQYLFWQSIAGITLGLGSSILVITTYLHASGK